MLSPVVFVLSFFFLLIPRPPISTLFPYTTLFRSQLENEIQHNGWLHCDADPDLIFGDDVDDKYLRALRKIGSGSASRSEEHTSELQSHSDLVCRLLLEKKKKIQNKKCTKYDKHD